MKFAIIDLGSNSIRMDIVEIKKDGSSSILHQVKETVRLSEGMGDEKMLKNHAVMRTLQAIEDFKRSMEAYHVDEVIPIATAAVRQAKNPELLTDELKGRLGIELKVISGEEEAYYDYLGVKSTIDEKDFLVIDIGGASTELILSRDGQMIDKISIPIGAVNLTEKFFPNGEVLENSRQDSQAYIVSLLDEVRWLKQAQGMPLAALGGTVRALANIDMELKNIKNDGVHGYYFTYDEAMRMINKIMDTPKNKRDEIPGLNKDRVDIITGGVSPMIAVMNYINTKGIITCEYGLRTGVFYEKYNEITGKEDTNLD